MTSDDPHAVTLESLSGRVGDVVGVSPWFRVDQERIDRFAAVTEDRQFIHVDPVRARIETPFGGTVAHGFLTLSLLAAMGREALPTIVGFPIGINYGFDKVRFLAPVPSGARIRGRFTLLDVSLRSPGEILLRHHAAVEVQGEAKPALIADWLTLAVRESGG
jgi:acyl dehydratase